MYTEPLYIPKGWQCPVCKRVYAPDYPWCTFCGQEMQITTTTTNDITKLDKKNETILKASNFHPGYVPDIHLWGNTKTGED